MGWLDQRFSAGPTPPGKTPGATPGCTTIKTVNVDIVSLDGSTGNGPQDLERASSIFNQCCVRFALARWSDQKSAERTRALLGGDNVLEINSHGAATATAEEIAMFTGATADFNLSSRIRAFYVGSITPSSTPEGHTDAYSVPPSLHYRLRRRIEQHGSYHQHSLERGPWHTNLDIFCLTRAAARIKTWIQTI